MSLEQLLSKREIKANRLSKQDRDNIRGLVAWDLADVALKGLSANCLLAAAFDLQT